MCGRFTLSHREARVLAAELGVSVEARMDYRPRYNIAPTDSHWIVRSRFEDREVLPAKWGLVNFWMIDRKQAFKNINARAETIQTAPSFREAFKERRCVVPADGFFEWTGPKDESPADLVSPPRREAHLLRRAVRILAADPRR